MVCSIRARFAEFLGKNVGLVRVVERERDDGADDFVARDLPIGFGGEEVHDFKKEAVAATLIAAT